MTQNIYDNNDFFLSYKTLRETEDNYNILLEQPAMLKRLPNVKDKAVIDLSYFSIYIHSVFYVKPFCFILIEFPVSSSSLNTGRSCPVLFGE